MITSRGALNTPLGLILAPNGDVLTVNGGNGLMVETTPSGMQVAKKMLDRSGSPPGDTTLTRRAAIPRRVSMLGMRVLRSRRPKRPFPVISRETVAFTFDLSGLGVHFA